jgi:hypothetical protein
VTLRYFIQFFAGETEALRTGFRKYPGSIVIETDKANFDFLKDELIRKGIQEEIKLQGGAERP